MELILSNPKQILENDYSTYFEILKEEFEKFLMEINPGYDDTVLSDFKDEMFYSLCEIGLNTINTNENLKSWIISLNNRKKEKIKPEEIRTDEENFYNDISGLIEESIFIIFSLLRITAKLASNKLENFGPLPLRFRNLALTKEIKPDHKFYYYAAQIWYKNEIDNIEALRRTREILKNYSIEDFQNDQHRLEAGFSNYLKKHFPIHRKGKPREL